MTRASLAIATLLLILSACAAAPPNGNPPGDGISDGNGPPERVFGTIDYYEQTRITVPSEAEVGKPFAVTIATYGDGCTEKGETDVRLEARRAEIRPYDYNVAPGGVCDDILNMHEHTTTLSFAEAGEAEIVFYGQRVTSSGRTNTAVTRTLEVAGAP